MIKNVLPFFLDGGIQEASGATYWNGTSSFVESTGNAAIVVDVKSPSGRPVKPGTLLTVTNRGGTIVSVAPLADFSANDDTININDSGASVLLMFKGPSDTNKLGEWVVLSKFQADTDTDTVFTGGTVTNATTFNSNVTVGDADTDIFKVVSEFLVAGTQPTLTIVDPEGTGTVSLSTDSADAAGVMTFGGTWNAADTVTVTFNNSFDNVPAISVTGHGADSSNFVVNSVSASAFQLRVTGTMSGDVSYIVIGTAA